MDESLTRELCRHVERRSYQLVEAAERFLRDHRWITSNQAHGLANVISSEEKNVNTVLVAYVQHQGRKATSQNNRFWEDLKRELEGLRKQAQEIQEDLGNDALTPRETKEQLARIHMLIVRDYVQHLVAHNEYQRAMVGDK